ncbi:MAG: hypothetical protein QXL09_02365 [Candidatus Aenigmatarchaeota archaeon]
MKKFSALFIVIALGLFLIFFSAYILSEFIISFYIFFILFLFLLAILFGRKTSARIIQIQTFTPISQPTVLECPKCGSKLKTMPGKLPPLYACPECGYYGPIGLKPEKNKK